MDRLFEDSFVGLSNYSGSGEATLAIDMYETDNDVVVKTAVPGVKPEDIDISVQGDVLTIRGETKQEQEGNEGDYHRRERWYGAFTRTVQLPTNVKTDKADAQYDNGILTLRLPKAEESKPRKITIKQGNGQKQQTKTVEGKAKG
jgi:HSP20 family protein